MSIVYKGYSVDFHRGSICRRRDSMMFNFKYNAKGVVFPEVERNMLPAYIRTFVEKNAEDFLAVEYP